MFASLCQSKVVFRLMAILELWAIFSSSGVVSVA